MNPKIMLLVLAAMLSVSFACATYLGSPSDEDKAYFRAELRNISVKEFGGSGVAIGAPDMEASIYVYRRQTLTSEGWTAAFKDAFATNPSNWTQVYDYVFNVIKQSDLYETFGYVHMNNQTYWVENTSISNTSFSGNLIFNNASAGTVTLNPLFWSFWAGNIDMNGSNYKLIFLKSRS